jgi:LytS/YehU family sensor histidine kinase
LSNFIELQKLRLDRRVKLEYNSLENIPPLRIAPMLLIPFIENAFKHVSHFTERKNEISIDLQRTDTHFYVQVTNTKDGLAKMEREGGIGLKNVKRRLDLLYPDRHTLDIQETSDYFRINLLLRVDTP